ncbi:sugar kinase [Gilvimarinus polysaccharolyticus]|uniref:sugar kinase n=1 Tax=Gilvimarinus polysaccharolyticus TaxID=863921 RepID=UPI000673C2BA|nr:sugar kinase [Gilvimarinus polysaccharolyticus]
MSNIMIFGEPMLELTSQQGSLLRKAYAGDVFSVAVYLARLVATEVQVSMLSAIGGDKLSAGLRQSLQSEGVNTSHLATHPHKHLGVYLIDNDEQGEREFFYWRNQSAARETVNLIDLASLVRPEYLYFSGISLAILDVQSRTTFKRWTEGIKAQGTQIIFDANFRPTLWSTPSEAEETYQWAFSVADIALPSMDDLHKLFNVSTEKQVCQLLEPYNIQELIIKNGPDTIVYIHAGKRGTFAVPKVATVVDTTAAGDSFNAGYLASRISGGSIPQALTEGCRLSAKVISQTGAIIPKQSMPSPLDSVQSANSIEGFHVKQSIHR